jgi:hypothetical protein
MNQSTRPAGAMTPAYRHSGTPKTRSRSDRPLNAEERERAIRAWHVHLMVEEMNDFGLRPPRGLTTVLDLFVDGRAGLTAIQAYLDQQLAAPVSSLEVEVRHA